MSFCGIQYAKILREVHDDDGTVFYHLQLRCTMAAACSSARISPILDTAMILAVSICVVRLLLAAAA